jgi:uncharacterized protein (TIGR02246 family)
MKKRRVTMSRRSDDLRAIKRLAAEWRSGWLAGDADALVSLYARDPVLMPQGHPAIAGKDAIRSIYRAVLKEVVIRSKGALVEVEACGDWGYFWSTYTLTAVPKAGGKRTKSKGKSLFIVKRETDGVWRISRLIDNSDHPG